MSLEDAGKEINRIAIQQIKNMSFNVEGRWEMKGEQS